jgi:A/G-specific adenine glycosylase
MKPEKFQKAVLDWFKQSGRTDLPWQKSINPYRVWVSEIMLQQTQVATVIPYFQRFMKSYPSVQTLAVAPLDKVLHLWTGLGYYARARNLHKTAQIVCDTHNGQFPDNLKQLTDLPGIGRSTAGAIRSIAFRKPAPILDGNVKRVLARFAAVSGWPGTASVHRELWGIAERYSPQQRTAEYSQAMMDLGATLCTKGSPNCCECPIAEACLARSEGKQQHYPGKKPKTKLVVKNTVFLLLCNQQGDILLQRNPPSGLWGGLWVFPQIDHLDQIPNCIGAMGFDLLDQTSHGISRHTFSHFHLDYQPIVVKVKDISTGVADQDHLCWYNPKNPLSLGMPAPVKALIKRYC